MFPQQGAFQALDKSVIFSSERDSKIRTTQIVNNLKHKPEQKGFASGMRFIKFDKHKLLCIGHFQIGFGLQHRGL
jgi:hypothetical protein